MKYKRFAVLALALCMLLPLAACALKPAEPWPETLKPNGRLIRGSGNVIEQKTQLLGSENGYALRITGISLHNWPADAELVIDESLAREVVITADDNIADRFDVRHNTDGEIVIERQGLIFAPTKLIITVGAPVRKLEINGAWRFTYNCPGVKECEVAIDGAANGGFTFGTLDRLALDVNGTGSVKLAGAAKQAGLSINGAANIRAFGLTAEKADVVINGTGSCEITAVKTLFADINGLGKVIYDGEPTVNKSINGLGKVEARNK